MRFTRWLAWGALAAAVAVHPADAALFRLAGTYQVEGAGPSGPFDVTADVDDSLVAAGGFTISETCLEFSACSITGPVDQVRLGGLAEQSNPLVPPFSVTQRHFLIDFSFAGGEVTGADIQLTQDIEATNFDLKFGPFFFAGTLWDGMYQTNDFPLWTLTFQNVWARVDAIPEPASALVLAFGLMGLLGARRWR